MWLFEIMNRYSGLLLRDGLVENELQNIFSNLLNIEFLLMLYSNRVILFSKRS